MAEFVISCITFLFCIMAIIQLALVLNAYALVRYAAYNAARAGIVWGGDQEKMAEAARVSLLAVFPRHGRADHLRGLTENYLAAQATDSTGALTFFGDPITETSIINQDELTCGTTITFDDPAQAEEATITVQVIHRYELVIPLVNRLAFWIYMKFRSGQGYQGETVDYLAAQTDKMRRTGEFKNIEYRIPLVAHYTMRLHSDYSAPACPTTTTTTVTTTTLAFVPPPPPPKPPPPPCNSNAGYCGALLMGFPCPGGQCTTYAPALPPSCQKCCKGHHCHGNGYQQMLAGDPCYCY